MYITYHKEVSKPVGIHSNSLPHIILDKEVRELIEKYDAVQEFYYWRNNGYYFFIYLDKGDRIDIEL